MGQMDENRQLDALAAAAEKLRWDGLTPKQQAKELLAKIDGELRIKSAVLQECQDRRDKMVRRVHLLDELEKTY